MKTITQEQINTLINQLAEAPAKFVFDAIITLQNLPEQEIIKPKKK